VETKCREDTRLAHTIIVIITTTISIQAISLYMKTAIVFFPLSVIGSHTNTCARRINYIFYNFDCRKRERGDCDSCWIIYSCAAAMKQKHFVHFRNQWGRQQLVLSCLTITLLWLNCTTTTKARQPPCWNLSYLCIIIIISIRISIFISTFSYGLSSPLACLQQKTYRPLNDKT
jgi:hypothetical protein